MKILDAYCGLGPWQPRDKLLPYRNEDILALMDHFGIAKALVHANMSVGMASALEGNRMVGASAKDEHRFIPAAILNLYPDGGADDFIDSMRRDGAKAAWIFVRRNGGVPGLWNCLLGGYLEALSAHRVPVFLHADDLDAGTLDGVCASFPTLNVILAGAGYKSDSWVYALLRKHANLRVCLGHFFNSPRSPAGFVRRFGAERLVFGSGLPRFSPGGLIGMVMYADIEDEAKSAILAGNLERLLAEATP